MTQAMTIKDYIQNEARFVEEQLRHFLPSAWDVPQPLKEAMAYSLHAGGKRLRPILVLAAAESLGGNREAALPIACAVEMVHTYSLIHDDLPALDNDDFRRGMPTNHKVHGEAMAILAGDALLTHAFYVASDACLRSGIAPEQGLALIRDFAEFAGARGMVGGQVADMVGEQGITRLEELQYIHTHKTGDLIVFSVKAGGRLANANEEQMKALEKFGRSIGMAFQILDDILDITGDEQKLGKPVKSDEKQQKVTYPYFIGLEESKKLVREHTEAGKQAINQAHFPFPQRLLELADYMMDRDY
ncbi:polyprenyl synthetase family protein [Paenibacillus senegalensis]|uniref:polyprenyl synthetase family protein n=1 Tax=Paenibacillus senegalensis TaxID=1465766 RepID=UPI0002890633|nr:farnesyl diphosphate synthase [Paenibacillus senegalensis]